MPEVPAPVEQPADDPYDLGDTSLSLGPTPEVTETKTPEEAHPPGATAAPGSGATQPRNPDGTFAPRADDAQRQELLDLREEGRDWGYTDQDIDGMTPDALRTAIRVQKRNHRVLQQRQQEALATEAAVRGNRQPAPEAPVEAEPDLSLGVDENEIHPSIVKVFKGLKADNAALRKELADIRNHSMMQAATTNAEKIDGGFASMPPRFHKYFGTMPASEMGPADEPFLNRRKLLLHGAGITIHNAGQGNILRRMTKAADIMYPAESPQPAPEPAPEASPARRVTPAEWDEATLQRPTQRAGAPEAKGPELAERNLRRKLGENAVDTRGDTEIMDGLLGR